MPNDLRIKAPTAPGRTPNFSAPFHLFPYLFIMDNQQNQAGSPMPGDDVRIQNAGTTTGSTGLGNDAFATNAAAGSPRKAGSARGGAQSAANSSATNAQDTPQPGREGTDDQQSGNVIDTALQSGKKWIEDSGILNSVNQLPQSLKDLGSRAATRVNDLSTTQKVVGGALLAVGLGWLATRGGKASKSKAASAQPRAEYGRSNSGYGQQTPNSFGSRRPGVGPLGRPDNDSLYGKSNSSGRYGNGGVFSGGASEQASTRSASRYGDHGTSYGNAATGDRDSRTSGSSYRKGNNFGGNE